MNERAASVLSALPRGTYLDDDGFAPRHRIVVAALAVSLPALVAVGLANGHAAVGVLAGVLVPAGATAVAVAAPGRRIRACASTVGLLATATVLVSVTGGAVESHFSFFVVLGLVALYQDWRPFLLAVAYVVAGHAVLGVVASTTVFDHPAGTASPWRWAALHGGFILAAAAIHVVFWKLNEREAEQARRYHGALYEGGHALAGQLQQARDLKDELIAVVGHEFRTPLASIIGFARTLDARIDEMDPAGARTSAAAIQREAKRLTRMVGNLLTASEDLRPRPGDRTSLAEVLPEIRDDVLELTPSVAREIHLSVGEGHDVAVGADAANLLLFNLLDNAVKFADRHTDIRASTRREGDDVVVEVTNVGPPILARDRERIFDAFTQGDSSDTRRYGGIGMGLHIARKVVQAHGGRIGAYCDGRMVIFRVWLPAVDAARASPGPSGIVAGSARG